MSCTCQPPTPGAVYAACAGVGFPEAFADDNTLLNIAASAGARSSDFTMCLAMAFLKTRRMIYWKVTPGDCSSQNFYYTSTTLEEAQFLKLGSGAGASAAGAASAGIGAAILSGLNAIFGGFLQAHIQAVQTEETTLCQVATEYNQTVSQIEGAVASGQLSPGNANAIMDSIVSQLDPVLTSIAKVCCNAGSCDAACGFKIALRALQAYNEQYVFPGLAPSNPVSALLAPVLTPAVPPSAGAPGTYQPSPYGAPSGQSVNPGTQILTAGVPSSVPTSIPLPGGVNGFILVGGGLIAAKAVGAL